jgi:protoheme IX farnesyltransferase
MNRFSPPVAVPLEVGRQESESENRLVSDLFVLTKARLSLLVIITTFVGYCMATRGSLDWVQLFNATLGTALAAAAAGVLNQYLESHVDRLMERTRHRPLPARRMRPVTALWLGVVLALAGVAWLWFAANAMSAYLAAATVAIYLFFYTPLKRKTSFCIVVGAVSGAIPPVIGWTAARPSLDFGAWVLFGVLFAWQMPHFLAIAWMYRDEYAQAGFVMLKRDDVSGCATAMQSLLFTLGLSVVTLAPWFAGMNTAVYLAGALSLDAVMLACAVRFLFMRNRTSARGLFFASIVYLPLILGLMVFTKA